MPRALARSGNTAPAEQGNELGFAARAVHSDVTRRFDRKSRARRFVSVATKQVKRAFKYRFYPTDSQTAELSRTFGCVRKVYDLALAARSEELAFLSEVSSMPLQQTLRHLQGAFGNFWQKRATRLVRENQAIVIEDLTVRNMVWNQFCIVCAVRGCAMIGGDPGIEERRI